MKARDNGLLPRDDAREAALFFVVSALCFLAALAALGARSTYGAAHAWTAEVEGEYTLTLTGADIAAAEAATRLAGGLASVAGARLLEDDEVAELLKPTFGNRSLPADLPTPRLVSVTAVRGAGDISQALAGVLSEAGHAATIDSHADWAGDVRRLLARIRVITFSIVGLLASTAIAVIASATHAALLARRDIVDVLHIAGAADGFIAGLFGRRFWLLGLRAGAVGALLALAAAALAVFVLQSGPDRSGLLPQLSLDLPDLLILVTTPLIAGLSARLAAGLTVMRALKSML